MAEREEILFFSQVLEGQEIQEELVQGVALVQTVTLEREEFSSSLWLEQ